MNIGRKNTNRGGLGFVRQGLLAVLILSALLFGSCNLILSTNDIGLSPMISDFPETRPFNAVDLRDNSWYSITADLKYNGTHSAVYVERGELVSEAIAGQIGLEFDTNVYHKIRDNFAQEYDADKNGKIIILLLDIEDGLEGSDSYVAGYFDSRHMLDQIPSNRADMLFIDTDPGLDELETLNITLAHEFQHLVNYSEKVIRQGNPLGQDTWINEGLSAAAEYVYLGDQIEWKIRYYNDDFIGLIRLGENFLYWTNRLENYSTVYLFFQWLRIHAADDIGIYKAILTNPDTDYWAVVASAQAQIPEYAGVPWKDILRDWFLANALNKSSPSIYGYGGEFTTTTNFSGKLLTGSGGATITLFPGEGIYYRKTADEYIPTESTSIGYAAFDLISGDIEFAPPFTNEYLLAYHTSGTVSSIAASTDALPPSAAFVSAAEEEPEIKSKSLAPPRTRFPIGAVLGPDGPSERPVPRRPGR